MQLRGWYVSITLQIGRMPTSSWVGILLFGGEQGGRILRYGAVAHEDHVLGYHLCVAYD